MINLVSGFLSFYFDNAVLLTVLVSFLLLAWYRRAVTRSMQSVAHAPEAEGLSEDGCAVVAENSVLRYADAVSDVPTGEHTLADEQRICMRLIPVYTAGGAAAAAILTISFLFSLNDELYALRTFVIWYTYCWPIVPTLAVLLTIPQKKALLAFGGYVLVGAAIVLAWSALRRFALGHMDVFPVSYVKYYALFLAMQAWFPFLIIFITGNRRLRSASPFVLAGLLIFSFSNLVTDDGLTVALDNQVFRHYFLVFDHTLMRGLWFMLAALPVGYLCWRGLRWLSRRFERKAFSDTQLLVDSWWLIVAFQQASDNAVDFGWVGLAVGLLAFVAYRSVVGLGLAVWPATNSASGRGRLLLLRVFGSQRRSERLFDAIAQRWRLRGSVKLIAGADLAIAHPRSRRLHRVRWRANAAALRAQHWRLDQADRAARRGAGPGRTLSDRQVLLSRKHLAADTEGAFAPERRRPDGSAGVLGGQQWLRVRAASAGGERTVAQLRLRDRRHHRRRASRVRPSTMAPASPARCPSTSSE